MEILLQSFNLRIQAVSIPVVAKQDGRESYSFTCCLALVSTTCVTAPHTE